MPGKVKEQDAGVICLRKELAACMEMPEEVAFVRGVPCVMGNNLLRQPVEALGMVFYPFVLHQLPPEERGHEKGEECQKEVQPGYFQ